LAYGLVGSGAERYAAGQSWSQIVGGSLADVSGVSSIYGGITGQDIATGQSLELTIAQRSEMIGGGVGMALLTLVGGRLSRSVYGRTSAWLRQQAPSEMAAAIQRGGVQTPTFGFADRWRLWWKHRELLGELRRQGSTGGVLLDTIDVARTKTDVFRLMGELTAGGGREIALLPTEAGLVLRQGFGRTGMQVLGITGASRVIAHTHPNGKLGLSGCDYLNIFKPFGDDGQLSTIVVSPSGAWRRYTSNQTILGGSF
jgi:hypothetical protein